MSYASLPNVVSKHLKPTTAPIKRHYTTLIIGKLAKLTQMHLLNDLFREAHVNESQDFISYRMRFPVRSIIDDV